MICLTLHGADGLLPKGELPPASEGGRSARLQVKRKTKSQESPPLLCHAPVHYFWAGFCLLFPPHLKKAQRGRWLPGRRLPALLPPDKHSGVVRGNSKQKQVLSAQPLLLQIQTAPLPPLMASKHPNQPCLPASSTHSSATTPED